MVKRTVESSCLKVWRGMVLALCLAIVGCGVFAKPEPEVLAPPEALTLEEKAGDNLLALGKVDEALVQFEKARLSGADEASVAVRKGQAFFERHEWAKALEQFEQASKLAPNMALAWHGAGFAAFEQGDLDLAQANFEKTAELLPSSWTPHAFLAVIYQFQSKSDLAQAENQKTLDLAGEQVALADATIKKAMERVNKLTAGPLPQTPAGPGSDNATALAPPPSGQEEPLADDSAKVQTLVYTDDGVKPMGEPASLPSAEGSPQPGTVAPLVIDDGAPASDAPEAGQDGSVHGPGVAPSPSPDAPAAKDATQAAPPSRAEAPTRAKKRVAAADSSRVYTVLESAFDSRDAAEARVVELRNNGVRAQVLAGAEGSVGSGFRVVIGSASSRDGIRDIRSTLMSRFGLRNLLIIRVLASELGE